MSPILSFWAIKMGLAGGGGRGEHFKGLGMTGAHGTDSVSDSIS